MPRGQWLGATQGLSLSCSQQASFSPKTLRLRSQLALFRVVLARYFNLQLSTARAKYEGTLEGKSGGLIVEGKSAGPKSEVFERFH